MNSQGEAPLEGRVVVVTGAGRGIGRTLALAMSSAGADVVVNDLGTDVTGVGTDASATDMVVAEIEAMGARAVANHDDISTWAGARAAIECGIDTFGRLDGLVNNAGILRRVELADLTEDDFDRLTAVHLKGHFGCTVHALKYWRSQARTSFGLPQGAIVNTFSEAVLISMPGYAAYASAKAGIIQLTTVASREAAAYGVRVNAYAPRAVTRMMPGANELSARNQHPLDPANSTPLVVWLLSSDSAHVSGQVFQTLGGAVGLCTPWRTGDLVQPSDGRLSFSVAEVGRAVDSQIFGCRFPELWLT